MTWHLEIHTIDVGQGESSLIIAFNPTISRWSSILIDGGLQKYAQTIHNYIHRRFESLRREHHIAIEKLDHILVSHYDADHSEGIAAILDAQNLSAIVLKVAKLVAPTALSNSGDTEIRLAAILAAVSFGGLCGYTPAQIQEAETVARGCTSTDIQSAVMSVIRQTVKKTNVSALNDNSLCPMKNGIFQITYDFVRATLDALVHESTVEGLEARLCLALTQLLGSKIFNRGAGFYTSQLYSKCDVIDIGDGDWTIPEDYKKAVKGILAYQSSWDARNPDVLPNRRWCLNPTDLGQEILWSDVSNKTVPPPSEAPVLIVTANNNYIWGHPHPISGGTDGNSGSIGLILLFGNFAFYTGGDLPSDGEEKILTGIAKDPLPVTGTSSFYPPVTKICYFKCGHHGSKSATKKHFVERAKASAAVISCGHNTSYRHPDQEVINNLEQGASIRNFYLTNCNFHRKFVPASHSIAGMTEQFKGMKSRVAGCNYVPNLSPHQNPRGDIVLLTDQTANDVFTVRYECLILNNPVNDDDTYLVSRPFSDIHNF